MSSQGYKLNHKNNHLSYDMHFGAGTDIAIGVSIARAMCRTLKRQDTSPGTGEIRTQEVGDPLAKPAPKED